MARTFAADLKLKPWDPAVHAPCLGLINPASGPKKGQPILEVCANSDYYKDRVFNIVEVFKGSFKGGEQFVNFRAMLNDAKAKAIEKNDPKFRPRLLIGGGDGTASFALTVFFKTVAAAEGFPDTGNGFFWTDDEMEKYFPALIQMPLGTGNDLGRALGWGPKYPGFTKSPCCQESLHGKNLVNWLDMALSVNTPFVTFDVWGLMPPPGEDCMPVKVCELVKVTKVDGKKQCVMKPADPVAPFLIFLYLSFGFIAQVVSRFQPNRKSSQIANKIEMTKATIQIMLGRRAAQVTAGMEGLSISNLPGEPNEKNGTDRYFPPRDTRKASSYKDAGILNANSFVGGNINGADRASCCNRYFLCGSGRKTVDPTDGKCDFFRERLYGTLAKTGNRLMTDKKNGGIVRFAAKKGQGMFFQFDGEGRFAFHPDGEEWRMDIKQVLKVPMVVARSFRRNDTDTNPKFEIPGTAEEKAATKARLMKWVAGGLVGELNATAEEIQRAGFPLDGAESSKSAV